MRWTTLRLIRFLASLPAPTPQNHVPKKRRGWMRTRWPWTNRQSLQHTRNYECWCQPLYASQWSEDKVRLVWCKLCQINISMKHGRGRGLREAALNPTPPTGRRFVKPCGFCDLKNTFGDRSTGQPPRKANSVVAEPSNQASSEEADTEQPPASTAKQPICPFDWCASINRRFRRHVMFQHFHQAWKHIDENPDPLWK